MAPTKIQFHSRQRASSNTRDSRSTSKPSVPSTLNGPSGLLIGERNNENQIRLFQQTTNVSTTQRSNHQYHEANSCSAIGESSEQFPVVVAPNRFQSIIFNEEYIPNLERRVIIDEQFYKDSVFNRLGFEVSTRTYSDVVGQQNEYEQPPAGQKRIISEVPGPRKRINSNQAAIVNTKGSTIKITQSPLSNPGTA